MVTGFNQTPATLDELIAQCQEWDGRVVRIVPYFAQLLPDRLESVGIWVDDENDPSGGEYEQCWRLTSRGWVLSGDGAGDPCTNGGSVLTGRDLG